MGGHSNLNSKITNETYWNDMEPKGTSQQESGGIQSFWKLNKTNKNKGGFTSEVHWKLWTVLG